MQAPPRGLRAILAGMEASGVQGQRIIAAVSGGVDSVVMLHMLMQSQPSGSLWVAHVDHGIRPASHHDAAFVRGLAQQYGVPFRLHQAQLGPQASENTARHARYSWLRSLAARHQALIATAHHTDDIIESIAINLVRGTGWRGLAVMNAPGIIRPLAHLHKADIVAYATDHRLEWCEDETNAGNAYLRNRVRVPVRRLPATTQAQLYALWQRQRQCAHHIDMETSRLATWQRYFYCQAPTREAQAVLRATMAQAGVRLTRPQHERLLLAIKTARPGARLSLGPGWFVVFYRRDFAVQGPKGAILRGRD